MNFELVPHRFMEASEKKHDTTDANVRNHQASIKIMETQLRQLTTLVNERLPLKNQDPKPQPHVMAIYTEKEVHSEQIMTHEVAKS